MCSEVIFAGLFMFNMCNVLQEFTIEKCALLFVWKRLGGDTIYTFQCYLRNIIVNRQLSVGEQKKPQQTVIPYQFSYS